MNRLFAFLAFLAFLLAYIFRVANVHADKFFNPGSLVIAGLVFLSLVVADVAGVVADRRGRV